MVNPGAPGFRDLVPLNIGSAAEQAPMQ